MWRTSQTQQIAITVDTRTQGDTFTLLGGQSGEYVDVINIQINEGFTYCNYIRRFLLVGCLGWKGVQVSTLRSKDMGHIIHMYGRTDSSCLHARGSASRRRYTATTLHVPGLLVDGEGENSRWYSRFR